MERKEFDVLVIGAGPAGSVCAAGLGNSKLSIAILDKAIFPRDKICGDALSVDVVNQLALLPGEISTKFEKFNSKVSSYGVRIFSPDQLHIDIPFRHNGNEKCGYLCPRRDFDNLLMNYAKTFGNVQVFEDCVVQKLERTDESIRAHTSNGTFSGRIVVGADGAQSVVSRQLGSFRPDREHYSAGLRVYYEGVNSFHTENFIELYFFRDILPGYLWIFPLPFNRANVGIGMLSSIVSKKKINLKETLRDLIQNNSLLKERFKDAKPIETVKGYGLPLGSKKRKISGDRFLLLGDAASLIDPFTGEGIGNAIRSGRVAARHINSCFEKNDFSSSFNSMYDSEIYRLMWSELSVSRALQKLCRYPALFNFIVKKANQSKYIHGLLIDALAVAEKKKSLLHPSFYYNLLFK